MRQPATFADHILRSLLSILLLFAVTPGTHAQTSALSTGSVDVAPPAADPSVSPAASGATPVPDKRAPIVPLIGAGDLLKIGVLGAPESDQEVRVGADGKVYLNFIGGVEVAGKSTQAAQDLIAKRYVAGGFYTSPQVSVFVKEYATQGVSVLGQVLHPGVYPLLGSRNLFDVLALAGGTTEKAGKLVSVTRRDNPGEPITVAMSNDTAESVHTNIEIFPGDTVVVSKAGVVYVVGDVSKPAGVVMDNDSMTVLQAIAMVQGTNPTAALSKAKLIRRTPAGPKEIPLDLKQMLASKAPDVHLQAEDIVFVPNSAARAAGKRTLEAIIQTATGLAIWGVR